MTPVTLVEDGLRLSGAISLWFGLSCETASWLSSVSIN